MGKLYCFAVLFAVAALLNSASAQSPAKQFAVHVGRLIDVRSGQATRYAYIVVSGERIVSVSTSAPSGKSVVDMGKVTLVPGLVDAHGHTLDDPTTQSAGRAAKW